MAERIATAAVMPGREFWRRLPLEAIKAQGGATAPAAHGRPVVRRAPAVGAPHADRNRRIRPALAGGGLPGAVGIGRRPDPPADCIAILVEDDGVFDIAVGGIFGRCIMICCSVLINIWC